MPNYCYNSLSIHASHDTLERIKSFVEGREDEEPNAFDFNRVIPMPSDIFMGPVGPKEKEKYGKNNWYDWSWDNWGTKWNSWDVECSLSTYELDYNFYTAWNPCEPVIEKLVSLFPEADIRFSFYEPGCCFCGVREYKNGEIVYSVDGDYSEDWAICHEDEDEPYQFSEAGITYSVKDLNTTDDNTVMYQFTYQDADKERTILIDGECIDRRKEKQDFWW